MPLLRALLEVQGVEGHHPTDPLGPMTPPVIQANVEAGSVAEGEVVVIRVRCLVRKLLPGPPLPAHGA